MCDWAMVEGGVVETAGAVAASSVGTTVTAGALNTKGSWAELDAATARAAGAIVILCNRHGSGTTDYLIDIGIGAAGSEQVVISNLISCNSAGSNSPGGWWLAPLSIPAGTRLAARCQASTASAQIRVEALLLGESAQQPALSRVATYGAATADSGGTSIDPGGSANTKGAWTQLASATSADHQGLILGVGYQANGTRTTCSWLVDIGVGAAGSEQTIVSNLLLTCDASTDHIAPSATAFLPVAIPAGTRLAVRAQSDITNATDRLFDAVLYGVG